MSRKESTVECRHVDCSEQASRTITVPLFVSGLPPVTDLYCDRHADEILSEGLAFPGAREVTDDQ